jgi:hypothetical protein
MISYNHQPITSRSVALVMKSLGFHAVRKTMGRYYKLYIMDSNESQRTISNSPSESAKNQTVEQDLPF